MTSRTKQGVFAAIATNPRDIWAWCCLRDVLEAEGQPDEVLRVADQAGTWIGSREDWEREGRVVVDEVPVVRVWVQDCAPRFCDDTKTWDFYTDPDRHDDLGDPEEFPDRWSPGMIVRESHTLAEAQAWLTQVALDYARRVRGERKKEMKS